MGLNRFLRRLLILLLLLSAVLAVMIFYKAKTRKTRMEALLEEAEKDFKGGRWEEARRGYESILRIQPEMSLAHYRLGQIMLEKGEARLALEGLIRAYRLDSSLKGARDRALEILLAGRAYKQVAEAAEELLKADPRDQKLRGFCIRALAGMGKYEEALRESESLIKMFSEAPSAYIAQTDVLLMMGRVQDAEECLKRGIGACRKSARLQVALGSIYRSGKEGEKAEKAFSDALKAEPESAEARRAVAEYHLFSGRRLEAMQEFEKAFEFSPKERETIFRLASLYLDEGMVEKASQAVGEIEKLEPEGWRLHLLRGRLRLHKHNPNAAIEDLKKVVDMRPRYRPGRFYLAEAYLNGGLHESARDEAEEILRVMPNSREARLILARALSAEGSYEDAIEESSKLLNRHPDDRDFLFVMGIAKASLEHFSKAEECFRKILKKEPEDANAALFLVKVLACQKRHDEALLELERLFRLQPKRMDLLQAILALEVQAGRIESALARSKKEIGRSEESDSILFFFLGELYLRNGDTTQAMENFEKAAKLNPTDPIPLVGMAQTYRNRGENDACIEKLKQARELDKDSPLIHLLLGISMERGGQEKDARAHYLQIVKESRYFPLASLGIARTYLDQKEIPQDLPYEVMLKLSELLIDSGERARARSCVQRLFDIQPDSPDSFRCRALIRLREGELEGAIADLRRVLKKRSGDISSSYFLAQALQRSGRLLEASLILEKLPKRPSVDLLKASIYLESGRNAQAETECEKLLKEFPDEPRALFLSAAALFNQKKFAESEERLKKLLEIHKGDPLAQGYMGLLRFREGKQKEAMDSIEAALSQRQDLKEKIVSDLMYLSSNKGLIDEAISLIKSLMVKRGEDPIMLVHAGKLYLRKGERERASRYFQRALELDQRYAPAHFAMAMIAGIEGRSEETHNLLVKAFDMDPRSLGSARFLASSFLQRGQKKEALRVYEKALKNHPESVDILNNLAYCLAEGERSLGRALKLASKAREIEPENPAVLDTLGWIQLKRKEYEPAIYSLERAANLLSSNPEVRFHLGMAYYKAGDWKAAERTLRKAISIKPDFDGADEARETLAEIALKHARR